MRDADVQPVTVRLRRELTSEVLERVAKYARRRVTLKRRAGIACFDTDDEAANMAMDAATATALGQRVWDPDVPLFQHLCGVVRSVSSDEIKHARRARHRPLGRLSMDDSHDDDARLDAQLAPRGPARSAWPKRMITLTDASDRLLAGLRVLAHHDAEVRQLLDAFEDGCTDGAEAREDAGLSREAYRNARRRLDRMVDALPDNLDELAQDALEVSYGY